MVQTAGDRAGERVLTLRCAYCGDGFAPTRRHQKFCKPSCRTRYFKRRQPSLPLGADDVLCKFPFE
jgi:hypothetical protein